MKQIILLLSIVLLLSLPASAETDSYIVNANQIKGGTLTAPVAASALPFDSVNTGAATLWPASKSAGEDDLRALVGHLHDLLYLGINATAADSNKLNNQLAAYYATNATLSNYLTTGVAAGAYLSLASGGNVLGATTFASTLGVTGAMTVTGAVELKGTLTVAGVSVLNNKLGLGVTPSSWQAGQDALEVGTVGNNVWGGGADDMSLGSNFYYDGDYKYANNGPANWLQVGGGASSGKFMVLSAPVGNAGNPISWATQFIVNNSGNVSLATTDLAGILYRFYCNGAAYFNGAVTVAGQFIVTAGTFIVNSYGDLTMDGKLIAKDLSKFGNTGEDNIYIDSGAIGINRNVATGAQPLAASYAYQWTHSASTTAENDIWTLGIWNPSLGLVTGNALTFNGAGSMFFAQPAVASDVALHINSSTGLVTKVSSSRRYKTDIRPMDFSWNTFMKLKPSTFTEKSTGRKGLDGFIAEETIGLYPGECTVDKIGRPESVDYARMTAPLTAAVQDLKRENDELKAQLKAIMKRVEKLERRK